MVPTQTDEEKAAADAAAKAEKAAADAAAKQAKLLSGKVVKYVGTADVREIDAAAWKSLGIENGKVVWDSSNKHTVPVADLSPDAVAYLDKDDDGFLVADADVDS